MRKTVNNGRKAIFGLGRKMCSGKGVRGESSISPYQITSFLISQLVCKVCFFFVQKKWSYCSCSLSLSLYGCVCERENSRSLSVLLLGQI